MRGYDRAVARKLKGEANQEAGRQTFERVAREWYENAKAQWAKIHASDVIRSLERDVFPSIGTLPISQLTSPIVLGVLRNIEARGAIETAKRIRQRISATFVYAIAKEIAQHDPADILARAYRSAVRRASRDNRLQYRDPRGSSRLREEIATMLRGERGLSVEAENICITRGSQNGIFLAARTLVSPGDAVVVEALTYEPAVAAFAALGAKVVALPLDEHGIDVEALEKACRRNRVRAVLLTPHHQFPTTVALRPERRLRVLELARQFGFAVVEDDYDHEFHFESHLLLPMASYAPGR